MSFTLSGGRPTVEVSASAAIVSDSSTSATVRVTANSWMVYDGSSVQSSGVYAVITINGTTSSPRRIFGDCYPDKVTGTSVHSTTYDVTVSKAAAKNVSWSVAFHSYVDGEDLGTKDTKSGTIGVSAATYTISFNANGGSGAPSSQTKTYGSTLTLSSTKPTRSGYTFEGWGTSASDTSVDYAAGGSYTANADDELFAIWKKTIELSYDANKGSGAPSKQSATIYNATTSYTFTISSTKPTRTGYTFLGWSTSSGATSSSYSSGGSITLSSSDVLYAVWKANTYTIAYNSNGGTGTTYSQTHTYDTAKNLTSNSFTRTGYTFTGWDTNSDGSGTSYSDGASVMNLSSTSDSTVTLYAQWREHILTVHYKNNYATYAYVDGENKEVSADKKDITVRKSEYKYATPISDGLHNYSGVNDDTYMKRTRYEATGYWGTGSDPETESIIAIPEDEPFDSGAKLAERLGILDSFNVGDVEIDLYAQWVLLCSYTTIYDSEGNQQRGMVHFYVGDSVNFITSDSDMFKDSNDNYFMTNDSSVLHYGIITIFDSEGKAYMAV